MPLIKSGSDAARSKNIGEMIKSGRPKDQAVAASYSNQRRAKAQGFNKGGAVDNYEPSAESAFAQNAVETAANPTGPIGLEKGGGVSRAKGGWKRWGQK